MSYKPDGFTLNPGTWDTDATMDTSVYLSGDASMLFENTTPAADPKLWEKVAPCATGDAIMGEWTVRADSIAAGNTVGCYVYFLDSTMTYLSATAIFDDELPAADTWYTITGAATAPANARFAGAMFTKNNTAFHAYLDMMGSFHSPISFAVKLSADGDYATGTTLMDFDTEVYDHGDVFDSASNKFTAPKTANYMLSLTAPVYTAAAPDAGMTWSIDVYVNGASTGPAFVDGEGNEVLRGGVPYWLQSRSSPLFMSAGDYIELKFVHDNTANVKVAADCLFSAVEMR